MNVLILGGMSQRHHEWVRDVAEALRPGFEEVRFLDYRHWSEPGVEMDLEYEVGQAALLAEGLDEYIVVAKSIGTVVTTFAVARGLLKPERCVFMGFPLKAVETDVPEVADALTKLPPVVFMHNEHDPLGSSSAVETYLAVHTSASLRFETLPGDTHDYVDFAHISDVARNG